MEDDPNVFCARCPKGENRFTAATIMEHLREVHDIDEPIAEWPDGRPVIIDATLEPADFEDGA